MVLSELPQKLPPILPNMSDENDESPPVLAVVAVGVVKEPPPRPDEVVLVPPPKKELRVESDKRESPRREREVEPVDNEGSLGALALLDCPDLSPDSPDLYPGCPEVELDGRCGEVVVEPVLLCPGDVLLTDVLLLLAVT